MQADRDAGLAGHGAELGDGTAGAAGNGEREPRIGEHGPTGRPRRRLRPATPLPAGRPGCSERRIEGMLDDGRGRAECVGPDAEHDGVAAAQHSGGVGEHIGAALEDEPDDPETRLDLVDPPAVVSERSR